MEISSERLRFWAPNILIFLIFLGTFSLYWVGKSRDNPDLVKIPDFIILQENTLVSISNPANPPLKVVKKLPVIITAYSSTPSQTDDTPYITASGSWVKEGIVANNYLPFGTKIRIPEIYGDKVFTVEDRMSWKKGNYHVDIWFPEYQQALSFGAKRTYIEILEG